MLARRQPRTVFRLLDQLGKEEDFFSSLLDEFSHFHGCSPLKGINNTDFSPSLDFINEKDK